MKKILLGLVILSLFATNAFAADLSITITKRENWGGSRVVYGSIIAVLTPYTTGGLSVTPRLLGMDQIKNFNFSGINSAVYSFEYDYTNNTVLIYYTNSAPGDPAAVPATSDKFNVTDDDDPDGTILFITTGAGVFAELGAYTATQLPASAAEKMYPYISAMDSVTTIPVRHDTTTSVPAVRLRAGLTNADTLWFDDDATLSSDRLMYSGQGLGNMGDLFIPFGNGNFIKVAKKTNSQITVAAASVLYYDESEGLDDKLHSTTDGDADAIFSVDPTYASLPYFNPVKGSEVANATTVTVTTYFVAVGQ